MADKKRMTYEINLDINRNSLNNLKKSLSGLEKDIKEAIQIDPGSGFEKSLKTVQDMRKILDTS
jgi:hypothetical protein